MACNDWEELSLLYSSGELDDSKKVQFESHIAQCESCKQFLEQYQKDRESLFSIQMLGVSTSETIDKEIKRVCENGKKQYTSTGFFSVFAKKTIISTSFFLIGFVVVGYFMLNVQQAKVSNNTVNQTIGPSNPSSNSSINVAEILKADSVDSSSDVSKDSNRSFAKNRGNLEASGVVPVELITK
ncbi:MAG TPA: zf-HC2 domain-containing protein [Chitinispirillaceae bacterium]|nr:zf-HC2 domain-containing protein [Chitinispirillaceae bacterium]